MSECRHCIEIAAVRAELWTLYRDLMEGDVSTEAAEVAVSILDNVLGDKGHQSRRHPDIEALHDGG